MKCLVEVDPEIKNIRLDFGTDPDPDKYQFFHVSIIERHSVLGSKFYTLQKHQKHPSATLSGRI